MPHRKRPEEGPVYEVPLNPTLDRLTMALTKNGAVAAIRIIFQMSTDEELAAAWRRTTGQPGDPIADLLKVELRRREVVL